MTSLRIAIIGAGPSGLSAARFLKDSGLNPVVFEALGHVGGKALTVHEGDGKFELGTCYTTRGGEIVKQWMLEEGMTLQKIGEARFDGAPFKEYVERGPGAPLLIQVFKFLRLTRALKKAIDRDPLDPSVRTRAAMTALDFVREHNLPKIELALHRLMTAQGYGYASEATIGQTCQWCDHNFILSGVLNDLHMPSEGWSRFWDLFSQRLDVRLDMPVTAIDRHGERPVLHCGSRTATFDAVYTTLPMQAFNELVTPTPDEAFIASGVEWQNYTTSLISSSNWFSDHQVTAFSRALIDPASRGAMIGGRLEGYQEQLGGHLYITGQFSNGMTTQELSDLLRLDATTNGFDIEAVIQSKTWQYFPQYKKAAVEAGLFGALKRVQGQNSIWFGGATFSHELVASVVAHSKAIVPQMVAQAKAYRKSHEAAL